MPYDLVIIGGGINGAGVARDAALRGLRVALFEREDWGAGTTGASTRMIHGGIRYLLYDVPTTRSSSEDAARVRRIAPHLTFRIPFLWPLFRHGFMTEATEAFLSAYDRYTRLKAGLRHARLTRAEARRIEPGLAPDVAGALTLDEWGVDTFRLAALNALAAREAGADLFPHTDVVDFLFSGRTVRGIRVRDGIEGGERDVEARLVLNAGGPWADRIAARAGATVRLRPGKGIHVVFERRVGNYGMILEAVDGRTLFLVPHGAETIVGTTDDDYYGDPASVEAEVTRDEVAYVIEAAARVLPQARDWRPVRVFAGVRNTLFEWGVAADALSRRHEVIDHEVRDGVPGLLSLAGGKLASFRMFAEEATDRVVEKLGLAVRPCTTGTRPLPGAAPAPDFRALARDVPLPPAALERIWRRLGDRIAMVFDGAGPADLTPVCRAESVTVAEIRYAIDVEGCRTLDDLRRHTHLATGSCDGIDCAAPAAHLLADAFEWTPERTHRELEAFLERRWAARRPVLRGATLAQEEIWRGVYGPEGFVRYGASAGTTISV
ncbi:MAG TPA: glycerol-3-phosphate dehydrogenase/oxidase [Longimicrobiales bacterium]